MKQSSFIHLASLQQFRGINCNDYLNIRKKCLQNCYSYQSFLDDIKPYESNFQSLLTLPFYLKMKNIKLLKPQPSPKGGRQALTNITNYFQSRPRSEKETARSPSHSPQSTSRIFEKQSKRPLTPKSNMQSRFTNAPQRCINHRDKPGKYKVQHQSSACFYCESCAVELTQKGRKVVGIKVEDQSQKMIVEAKDYLKNLQDVMSRIIYKLSEVRVEKFKLQSRFEGARDDIQQERQQVLLRINSQYDSQIFRLNEQKKRMSLKLQEQQQRLKKFQAQFKTIKQDVTQNLSQINIHIDGKEFREIMNIYWEKVAKISQRISKIDCPSFENIQKNPTRCLTEPSRPEVKTSKINTPQNRQLFTFSKNIRQLKQNCKQAFSWQASQPDSVQSVVQERIRIK